MADISDIRNHLQDCPPEIRNMIYQFAIVFDQPVSLSDQQTPRVEPALLLTSKSIRAEAIGIFYHLNSFTSSQTSSVGAFLQNLSGDFKEQKRPKAKPPINLNRLAYLQHLSVPFPNKMSKEKRPREIPRSLRENRRCLQSFDRDFGRHGMKKGMLTIAMMVWDGEKSQLVHATSKTVDQYETVVVAHRRSRNGMQLIVPRPP